MKHYVPLRHYVLSENALLLRLRPSLLRQQLQAYPQQLPLYLQK
jgi:hypothetical protein